jgi:hypothetical protein
MQMSRYVRLCRGLSDKGVLIKPEEIENSIQDYDQDHYVSVYYYNEDHYKRFQKDKTIRGINDVVTDKLVFDFDSKNNLEQARQDTLKAISRLSGYGVKEDCIEVYFSGSKGFTLLTKLPKLVNPDQLKSIAINKIGKDLSTLDVSLYNASRILRVPGTKHNDTGLYKIPLSMEEINVLKIEQIKELAKESFVSDPAKTSNPNADLYDIPVEVPEPLVILAPNDLDLTNKSPQWKDYKWALLQGHFDSGERHNALMVIAATCRGLGYDKDTTFYMCKAASEKQAIRTNAKPFDEEELKTNIIEQSVFSPHWSGGQFSYKNSPWIQAYCKRMGLIPKDDDDDNKLCSLSEIETGFTDYVKNIEENTILTGITRLDTEMPLTIGMNLGIVGAASSGKTAIALEILKNTSKSGVVSVFASLDMHRNRLFEKLLYKSSGLSRNQIYQKFKEGKGSELTKKIKEDYGNVYFYDRSCPSVADIRKYIAKVEMETDRKVKLVMVDYFERVNSDRSEETAASKDVAGQLQDLINDLSVCLITLVQPNKFSLSGGPDSPITSYTAIKGSSFLYQSFRSILSIWRPFFTPETKNDDRFMQMAILKNDLGELNLFNFSWEGRTGTISELAEEQQEELNTLLQQKDNRRKKVDNGGW